MYEDKCAFVSKVPNNPVGMSALNDWSTNVVYDRAFSAFSLSQPSEYYWENILEPSDIFYFSGVTPAVSKYVEDTVRSALKYCKENDIQVICEKNVV